ncbi:MAG: serine hydrolase [Candidatus Bipolaricaulota bacterium]
MTDTSMEAKIKEQTSSLAVDFGIAVRFLETEEQFFLNEKQTYQLASVFKVPVLFAAMKEVEDGSFSLDQRIELRSQHKTKPSGILPYLKEGLTPTFEDLLTLMIIISDNTATDMVLELLGGPETVNEIMREIGFSEAEINITMSVHDLFEDIFGSSKPLLTAPERINELDNNGVNLEGEVYGENSTANVATPRAINELYGRIYTNQHLSQDSCELMLDILLLQTINERIPRFLPPEIPVAHKTGTLSGIRNDSGIIYISDDCHACVTTFTRSERELNVDNFKRRENEEGERIDKALGRIGEIVYEEGRHFS